MSRAETKNTDNFISREISDFLFPEFINKISRNQRTMEEYFGYIGILCNRVLYKDFLQINELDAQLAFKRFKDRCKEGKLSIRTVKVRLSCYNSFASFIEENHPELGFVNPFADVEKPYLTDEILPTKIPSIQELDKILTQAKKEPMYYLIIAMTTRTGISPSKLLRLTINSISEEEGVICLFLPDHLEKKTTSIVLPDDIGRLLMGYITGLEKKDGEGHLFYNKYGNALTLKNIDSNIKRIVRAAGVEGDYTLKDLRSRAILDMLKAGASEQDVCAYVSIGGLRVRQFSQAKGILRGCPANLVNYQIKVETPV